MNTVNILAALSDLSSDDTTKLFGISEEIKDHADSLIATAKRLKPLLASIESDTDVPPKFSLLLSILDKIEEYAANYVHPNKVNEVNQKEANQKSIDELLSQPLKKIGFTTRIMNCMNEENIYYLGDLVQRTYYDLLKIPNLSRTAISQIETVLKSHGLALGTRLEHWPPQGLDRLN